MNPGVTTRNKRSLYFLAAGLVFIAAGWVLGSGPCSMVGFTFVALVVRYRNNAAPWEYLCFVALLTALLVWGLRASSWLSSPLLGRRNFSFCKFGEFKLRAGFGVPC